MADRNLRIKLTANTGNYESGMNKASITTRKFSGQVGASFKDVNRDLKGATININRLTSTSKTGLSGISSLYAGQYATSIYQAVEAQTKLVTATSAQVKRNRELAQAQIEAANAELLSLANAGKRLEAAKAEYAQAGMMNSYRRIQQALINKETAATERLALAQQRLVSLKGTLGRSIFATIGGIPTVITAVIGGLSLLYSWLQKSKQETANLSDNVDKLTQGMKDFNSATLDLVQFQLSEKLRNAQTDLNALQLEVLVAQKKFERATTAFDRFTGAASKAEKNFLKAKKALDDYNDGLENTYESIAEIEKIRRGGLDASEEWEKQKKAVEQLKSKLESLKVPLTELQQFQSNQDLLKEGLDKNILTYEEYYNRLEYLQAQHIVNIAKSQEEENKRFQEANLSILNASSSLAEGFAAIAKTFGSKTSGAYRALFAIAKGFAIAEATLKLNQAIMQVLASPASLTPAQKFANVAAVASAGGSVLQNIANVGMSHDGFDSIPKTGSWYLEKDERVLSKHQNKDLTDYIKNGGKQPSIVINNNAGAEVNASYDEREEVIRISVERAVKEISGQLSNGTGETSRAMRQRWTSNVRVD